MKEKPFVLRTALAVVTSTALLIGCASRNDAISQAERRDDGRPGFEETRAAPDGPIYLVMRLYWPKETPPSILPPSEVTWKPPAVKPVS
jgi:hypothetical protein